MQLSLSTLVSVSLLLVTPVVAFPRFDVESVKRWERRQNCNAGVQIPRKFVQPKPLPDGNKLKRIPGKLVGFVKKYWTLSQTRLLDAHHPYRAPGPGDTRGPCPAMNTLANHGYINRT
jgi:hypothetical protein